MSSDTKKRSEVTTCPACGGVLPPNTPAALCPSCLLRGGLQTEVAKYEEGNSAAAENRTTKGMPSPGTEFGGYRLIRRLGGGGMGVVYEAEEIETSRRVALKLLSQGLDSPESRKRFLREGQLAAGINHPNCVYVYGTTDIAGTPAISMELMAGGTVQDRVASGPLKISEAIDCILQVIAGLEAAQRVGILHRDVKPSNCFITGDGVVKIGDFGLSISTSVRTEPALTTAGLVMGTPAFSSPEQLRGDELTARSDIYSVGVTLYYLLTGKTPFQASNVVQMLATVLEKLPESPGKWRADIPSELCRVILKCLEKDAGERYANYSELHAALLPFSSMAPAAAMLGRRFLAGFIDLTLIGGVSQILESGIPLQFTPFYPLLIVYYTITEGWSGRSLGKRIVGIKVASSTARRFGFFLAFARATLFAVAFFIFDLSVVLFLSHRHAMNGGAAGGISVLALSIPLLLLFSTARRRNGWRGIHDLIARTRVVMQSALPQRKEIATDLQSAPTNLEGERVGPYLVFKSLGQTDCGELLVGYDPRLLRKVWIHKVSPGTAPVAVELRQRARPGRLRWLAGRRSENENWDAYEGADGMALANRIIQQRGWGEVRFWLFDLATELQAAGNEPTRTDCSLDRVWITERGNAKILDFTAPQPSEVRIAKGTSDLSPHTFLLEVAASALGGRLPDPNLAETKQIFLPVPIHAREILQRLRDGHSLAEISGELKLSLTRLATVTKMRRLFLFLSTLWAPMFLTVIVLMAEHAPRIQSTAQLGRLQNCLNRLESLSPEDVETRENLEIYTAGTFASVITNSWTMAQGSMDEIERQQAEATHILEQHPRVTAEDLAAARAKLIETGIAPDPDSDDATVPGKADKSWLWFAGLAGVYGAALVIFPAWVASLAFGGGALLRGFGLAIVRRDGQPASRWRALWRTVIASGPFLIATVFLRDSGHAAAVLPLIFAVALGTASALARGRTWQDRLAGTDLVAR